MGSIPAGLLGVGTLEWIKGTFDPARVESIMVTIIAVTLVVVGVSLIFREYFMPKRKKAAQARSVEWQGPDERETPGAHRLARGFRAATWSG